MASSVEGRGWNPRGDYLPYVDGLRALAVLAVLAHHAELPFSHGGFQGVDIFFVISGFIITRLIIFQHHAGTFSFIDFYERRIRRLLPAMLAVTLFVCTAGWFILLPEDYSRTGLSVAAVGTFLSNMLFWRESGYFDVSASIKPLLHTWSLAVEEQFYLVYPAVLVLLLARSSKVVLAAGLGLIAFLSLAASQYAIAIDPEAAFYWLPTRAWQLMLGAGVAIAAAAGLTERWHHWSVSLSGLVLVLLAFAIVGPETPFPGLAAVPASLGTAFLIAAGPTLASRFLFENRIALFFGVISYSLYLWHWPLLVFYRYRVQELPWHIGILLCAVATAIAWASTRYVEQPLRRGGARLKRPFVFLASFIAICVVLGATLYLSKGLPGRFDGRVNAILAAKDISSRQPGCMSERPEYRAPEDSCTYGATNGAVAWAVWGDSHAHALVDSFGELLEERGTRTRFLGTFGCPAVPALVPTSGRNRCGPYNEEALQFVLQDEELETVILPARHQAYLEGNINRDDGASRLVLEASEWPGAAEVQGAYGGQYFANLEGMIEQIRASGKDVVIVLPVPETRASVPDQMARLALADRPVDYTEPASLYARRAGRIREALQAIAERTGAFIVDPMPFFCDESACRVSDNGQPLYYDDDHIAPVAAREVGKMILSATGNRLER